MNPLLQVGSVSNEKVMDLDPHPCIQHSIWYGQSYVSEYVSEIKVWSVLSIGSVRLSYVWNPDAAKNTTNMLTKQL